MCLVVVEEMPMEEEIIMEEEAVMKKEIIQAKPMFSLLPPPPAEEEIYEESQEIIASFLPMLAPVKVSSSGASIGKELAIIS